METILDEWFEKFNLEEVVKKLERSKANVINTDDAKVDDNNREMIEESEVKEEKKEVKIVIVDEVKAKDDHEEQEILVFEDKSVDATGFVDEMSKLIEKEVAKEIIEPKRAITN